MMNKKPCKYHCEYSDGQYCTCDGDCFMNPSPVKKPPIGCPPYYVSTSARICELCDAIKRYSIETDKHNKIALWCKEIMYLNEMDRNLRYEEKSKVWKEDKDGHLQEIP